ncbi:MAG: hypothetical protein Marn2KO_00750 [Marinobacter nauticus]
MLRNQNVSGIAEVHVRHPMLMKGFYIIEKPREKATRDTAAFRNILDSPPLYKAIMDGGRDV